MYNVTIQMLTALRDKCEKKSNDYKIGKGNPARDMNIKKKYSHYTKDLNKILEAIENGDL